MVVQSTATFKVMSEFLVSEEFYERNHIHQMKENIYFKDYKKVAEISSPFFEKPVKIIYEEYQTFTDSAYEDMVRIEVTKPIHFHVMEKGLDAESSCEKAICVVIENAFRKKAKT